MIEQKPPSAPICWGRQYDEGDKECTNQCEYRLTCKPAFFRGHSTGTHLPVYQPTAPQPIWPAPTSPFPSQQPQPIRPIASQSSPFPTYPPSLPPATTFAQPTYTQTSLQPNIVQQLPHSQYFTQYYSPYPGETVLERLAKHMLLRLGQIIFHELASFLGLWRWPPNK